MGEVALGGGEGGEAPGGNVVAGREGDGFVVVVVFVGAEVIGGGEGGDDGFVVGLVTSEVLVFDEAGPDCAGGPEVDEWEEGSNGLLGRETEDR